MSNKGFLILLGGCIVTVVAVLAIVSSFLPSFIAPFVITLYGLWIIYMTR